MAQENVNVTVSHRFNATAGEVYRAWLDPASAGRWLFATPRGKMKQVEIDAQVGGRFCIVEERDGADAVHRGEYLELVPPQRLVFRFYFDEEDQARDQATESTVVRVEISPLVIGGCMLSLIHEHVAAQWAEQTRKGWSQVLAQLDAALSSHEGEATAT